MNPIDMLKAFISGGGTPEQFLTQKILGKMTNPMVSNLIQMAQKGDEKSIEQFARNMLNERGRDFDKEFSEFMGKMQR